MPEKQNSATSTNAAFAVGSISGRRHLSYGKEHIVRTALDEVIDIYSYTEGDPTAGDRFHPSLSQEIDGIPCRTPYDLQSQVQARVDRLMDEMGKRRFHFEIDELRRDSDRKGLGRHCGRPRMLYECSAFPGEKLTCRDLAERFGIPSLAKSAYMYAQEGHKVLGKHTIRKLGAVRSIRQTEADDAPPRGRSRRECRKETSRSDTTSAAPDPEPTPACPE